MLLDICLPSLFVMEEARQELEDFTTWVFGWQDGLDFCLKGLESCGWSLPVCLPTMILAHFFDWTDPPGISILLSKGISNLSQSCISCGLISALLLKILRLLIENIWASCTQDGSSPIAFNSCSHFDSKLLIIVGVQYIYWLVTHIVVFSYCLIHMHRIPQRMHCRTILML